MANLCHAVTLALTQGRSGGAYAITDQDEKTFRAFTSGLLATQSVRAPWLSVPRWMGRLSAAGMEALWRLLRLTGAPPLTRNVLALIGNELSFDDALARAELGYTARVTYAEGVRELAEINVSLA